MSDIDIIKILEDSGVDKDKIDQVVASISAMKSSQPADTRYDMENYNGQVTAVKLAMDKETDWRKKAELAARLISLELDI
jgi:hypothetical protein